jgi:hypothetical protein
MPLPTTKQECKKLIQIALLLKELPPERRKTLMVRVMGERGLQSRMDLPPWYHSLTDRI